MNRVERGDVTEPETDASEYSMKERKDDYAIADDTKSPATTERDGLKFERKAKKEHPKAPEPIMGMNDDKGEVSW